MPVREPKKRLGRSIGVEFVQKMIKGHGRISPLSDLNVTPMVDMLVMLVIFLLMTFSATGEILFITKDIVLPNAFNATAMERAPVIAISNSAISFEGDMMVNLAGVTINDNTFPGGMIKTLKEKLDESRESWRIAHPNKDFNGQIIIQAHNEVPFSVLKLVMKTCVEAQFQGMNFAIRQSGRGEPAKG